MMKIALFGAGRIGRMHGDNLAANPRVELSHVYDVYEPAANEVAERHGAIAASDVESVLADGSVDGVLIASSTDTHVDLITASAQAGKAVLCEKPIDLDIARVEQCRLAIADCNVPVQIGFNRRFDPTHRGVYEAVRAGEAGKVEQIIITSRDPSPPPAAYIRVSGGLFRDMMIHDFDLARFLMNDEFVAISAMGSVLVEPEIGDLGDVDSAMVVMHTAAGAQCHINCSRRAVYGYDQRAEVFGSAGMVRSDNRRQANILRDTATATDVRDPLTNFFIDRYPEAYVAELDDFIDAIEEKRPASVTFEDGRRALMLADAANESLNSGKVVTLNY